MSCEYCRGEKELHRLSERMSLKGYFFPGVQVDIDDGLLRVICIPDVYEPGFEEEELPINFCPVCGEKLKEGADHGRGCMTEYKIQMQDVPEQHADIARLLGLELFLELCQLAGGLTLYLPRVENLARAARDREICANLNGRNYRQLASQYHLSERYVRKIIRARRPSHD